MLVAVLASCLVSCAAPPAARAAARPAALARYGVGLLRVRADRPAGALAQFEAAATADPAAAAPKAALAPLYVTLGRPAAAVRVARLAVAADPADFATGQLLAKLLTDVKRHPEAVAALTVAAASPRLAADPPRRLAVLADLAQAAANAGDWTALEAAAWTALPLAADPAEAAAWQGRLGRALENTGKYAAATAAYRAAAGPVVAGAARGRLAWHLSGVLRAEGQDAEALAELEKALALKPAGAAPYDRLADLYARLGRAADAPARLAEFTAADPANPVIRWVQADALARTDPAAAASLFRELADAADAPAEFPRLVRFHVAEPGRVSGLLDLLDAYAVAARAPGGVHDAAASKAVDRVRALTDAVKADPAAARLTGPDVVQAGRLAGRQPDTRELLYLLADRAGNLAAAEAILSAGRAAASEPLFAAGNPFGREVGVLVKQRKWAAVLTLCDQAAANPPRGRRPGWNHDRVRAHAYYELGRGADALAALDAAAVVGTDPAGFRLTRAVYLTGLGRAKEAVALCEAVLAEHPAPEVVQEARLTLADAHTDLGELAQADEQYDLCLDADPDSVLVLNNYGYNLADRGRRLADAEAMLRYAVELHRDELVRAGSPEPASGTYLDSLGWVLFRRGKLAESVAAFERAAGTGAGAADGVVWDHLGDVYARLNRLTDARAAWTKAVELYAETHQGRRHGRRAEVVRKLSSGR